MRRPIVLTMVSLLALSACAFVAKAEVTKQEKDTCEMMYGCSQATKKDLQEVNTLIQAVDEGRKSNDAKKMKSALEIAYKSLNDLKDGTSKSATTFERLKDHMDKVEAQSAKVKEEQKHLDMLIHGNGLDVPFIIH